MVLALKGIILLREEEQLSDLTFLLMIKYYEVSLKFCLNEEDRDILKNRFNEIFADYKIGEKLFEIDNLLQEMCPLGVKQIENLSKFDQRIKK